MVYPRVVLQTVFTGCCALLIAYSPRAQSASSDEPVSDSNAKAARDTEYETPSVSTSNQQTSAVVKPSQIRNRRSNPFLNDEQLIDDNAGLNSAFLYSDQIMQNLFKTQSPRPLNYARSNFFLNLLKPRTTRFNAWDDHSLMHFGKRSGVDGVALRLKRSTDELFPNTLLHFGKKRDPDISEQSKEKTRALLTLEFPNFGTELEQGISNNKGDKGLPVNNDHGQGEDKAAQNENIEKKSSDPWHNMMSFGKKSENAWDQNMLHFGKREEPWHSMMSFGKKSDSPWDQTMLHFGKKDEPWHNMMSFGKKSDAPWDQNMLHFGKREEPWHNMMSFGKKSGDPWDQNMLHFGKREEPWHSMMSFGKKSDGPWDQNMLHFGKREEPWHSMMSFGKKSDSPWDQTMLHFGKREEPWHNMMSFGKKSDSPWDQNMLHFGKRDEPWHNMMSFGKKSDSPWDQNMLHFGKRDEPWHNMMSFGKKSDGLWDQNMLHFGKREEPWHNMMSFGKKSDSPWDQTMLHFGKREEPWHNMMSFGKKSGNPWDQNMLHFGKKDEPWHNMMSFGKKSDSPWDQNMLHFGKREEPWHNMMSFGKKSDSRWDQNMLHFGKREEPWHNMMSFGKKSDSPWDQNMLHFGKREEPWHNKMSFGKKSEISKINETGIEHKRDEPWHNMMSFGKKSENPWDSNTLHFGKREDPWHNMMSFGKKSDNAWESNTLHFGKKDEPWHNMMSFGKRSNGMVDDQEDFALQSNPWVEYNGMVFYKKSNPWDHNTLHFGKRSNTSFDAYLSDLQSPADKDSKHIEKRSVDSWNNHNTMHFGKKSDLDDEDYALNFDKKSDWESHNTLHFGKREPFRDHNTMHFGKREPWADHNTMHFGKREPFESHNTMHFGKRDPFENHNTMHFGKRDPFESHNTMHFGKRDPFENHNTMHFGKKRDSSNNQDNTEKPLQKLINDGTPEHEEKVVKSVINNKDNDIYNLKKSKLNEKVFVNKRSIHDSSDRTKSKDTDKDDLNKLIEGANENTNLKKSIGIGDKNDAKGSKLKNGISKIGETKRDLGVKDGKEFKVPVEKGKSLLKDEPLKMHKNKMGRSLKSIDSNFPTISVEEEQIMRPNDVNESPEYVQNDQNGNNLDQKHFKSQRHKRSAESNYKDNDNEGSQHTDSNLDSFDLYSKDRIPDTVLHFGKRSLDDIYGDRENMLNAWMVDNKRYDNLWDNHNTMHFGKKSDPWERHTTLHFGKRSNPWDSYHTMHFGKRDPFDHNTMHFGKRDPFGHNTMHFGKRGPWDHNTMHFGKRDPFDHNTMHFGKQEPWAHNTMHFGKRDPFDHNTMHFGKRNPWDHNTMHFGKRDESDYVDDIPDTILQDSNYQRLDSLLQERSIEELVNQISNRFPLNDPNIKENKEFMESLENLETALIYELRNKNIPLSEKLFLIKNFLKLILQHILSIQGNSEMLSNGDSSDLEDYYDDDSMDDGSGSSKEDYMNPGRHYLNMDNFGVKSFPVEGYDMNGNKGPPSTKLIPYPKDYKSKRSYLGKPELKRYFVPFQGPKSIVYPHAWFASQIRRSMTPRSTDFTRNFDLRLAEKKEDPFNSYMHFGRR